MHYELTRNPLSGFNSAGPRFKVRIRSLSHENMYLPVNMRSLPQMKKLLHGVSPLEVFKCPSIKGARLSFYELRKKFDFPYWACQEFKIRDVIDPHHSVPLRLNPCQHHLADIFIRNASQELPSKYIITKTVPRCGLTTCVQAYILWQQIHHLDHSITCAPSEIAMEVLKGNVARCLDNDGGRNRICLDDRGHSAFFQSFHTPHVLDRVPAGFVHLADMSKWFDPSAEMSAHILSNALNGWRQKECALFVIEGDRAENPKFRMADYQNYHIPEPIRLMRLSAFGDNPLFLSEVVMACDPKASSGYHYIDLDKVLNQPYPKQKNQFEA